MDGLQKEAVEESAQIDTDPGRHMGFRLSILLLAAVSLVLAGCNTDRSSRPAKRIAGPHEKQIVSRPLAPLPLQKSASDHVRYASAAGTAYTLGTGDRLRVTVFGQEELSRSYSVDAGGYISLPLIGAVEAQGATTFELQERIADALKRKYVKDPKVTVEVEAYRPFFILGEVKNAGQYPYVAGMTVQTAVAIAGGFTPRARKRSIQISRRSNGRTVMKDVPVHWKVRPGDTITVKERFF